jgi:hypothetical protein
MAAAEAVDRGQAQLVYRDVWAHPSYVIPAKPDSRLVAMKHIRPRLAEDRVIRYLTRSPRTAFELAAFLNKAEREVPTLVAPYLKTGMILFDGSFYSTIDIKYDSIVRHAS